MTQLANDYAETHEVTDGSTGSATAPEQEQETTQETGTTAVDITPEDLAKFSKIVEQLLGVPVETLAKTVSATSQAVTATELVPFASAWGCDIATATQRVDAVLDYIETLPQVEQDKYRTSGSFEDVLALDQQLQDTRRARSLPNLGRSTSTGVKQAKIWTVREIDNLSDSDRAKFDKDIVQAYRQGRVRQ